MTEPTRTLVFRTTAAGNHLLPAEPFPAAWHRVTAQLVAAAASDLHRSRDRLDDGVHEARKGLKRLRALLRLVRFSIGDDRFRQENHRLRDIGRSLSATRDAQVLIETLFGLYDRYDGLVADGAFAAAEALLEGRLEHAERRLPERAERAATAVLEAGVDLQTLGPLPRDYDEIGRGIRRVYRAANRAMTEAGETGRHGAFHEWRKRVKDLRHQLELLQPLQPALIGAHAAELDRLGDVLGLDHDLVVLGDVVMADPQSGRHDRERWLILALAHEWRTDLRRQALAIGGAVHAETSAAFTARIGGYWSAARD